MHFRQRKSNHLSNKCKQIMNSLVGASSIFFVIRYVSRGPLGKKKGKGGNSSPCKSDSELANYEGNIIIQDTINKLSLRVTKLSLAKPS